MKGKVDYVQDLKFEYKNRKKYRKAFTSDDCANMEREIAQSNMKPF